MVASDEFTPWLLAWKNDCQINRDYVGKVGRIVRGKFLVRKSGDLTPRSGKLALLFTASVDWAHDVVGTMNQWRWLRVATPSCDQWEWTQRSLFFCFVATTSIHKQCESPEIEYIYIVRRDCFTDSSSCVRMLGRGEGAGFEWVWVSERQCTWEWKICELLCKFVCPHFMANLKYLAI